VIGDVRTVQKEADGDVFAPRKRERLRPGKPRSRQASSTFTKGKKTV